jgi:Peptidase family M1 domain
MIRNPAIRILGIMISLWILMSAPPARAGPGVSENDFPLYQTIRKMGLQDQGVRVSGLTINKDAALIHLTDGDLWFLSPVNGKALGAVFIGRGEMVITPAVDSEKKFLAKLTEGSPFVETFKGLTLFFSDDPFQPFKDTLQTPSTAPAGDAGKLLQETSKLFAKGRKYAKPNQIARFFPWNIHARLLFDVLHPQQAETFFLASGDGEKYGDFVYIEDSLGVRGHEPEEVVLLNLSAENLGSWYAGRFSGLYKEGLPKDPHPRRLVEVWTYQIGARLEGRALGAVATMCFKPLQDQLAVLPLDFDSGLRISKVEDQNHNSVAFIQEKPKEDGNLSVIFPTPLEKDTPCELTFTYLGADSISDHGNGNFSLLARSNWYPNPGRGAYKAMFGMLFDIPAKTRLLATGEKMSERQVKDRTLIGWGSIIPLKVAGFTYGDFESRSSVEKASGCRIETCANKKLPNELAEIQLLVGRIEDAGELTLLESLNTVNIMEKVHAEAEAAVNIYRDCFGTLPYKQLAITQQPFYDFGQAWPTLIFIPISSFLPSIQRQILGLNEGFYTRSFFQLVCAHEVAHQWWGQWVAFSNYRDQWLSEGLAVFSSSLFAHKVYGVDALNRYYEEFKEQLVTKNRKGIRPIDMGGLDMGYRLDTGKTGAASQATIYGKGGYIPHMLRMMMWSPKEGDNRFQSVLKSLLTIHPNGFLTTDEFQAQVEKQMTPQMDLRGDHKMDWFFDQWVRGTLLPRYAIDYQLTRGEDGKPMAKLRIKQSQVNDDFVMLVPVYAQYGEKFQRLGQVRIKGNTETPVISIPLPERPKKLLLCAMHDILCELDK